MVIKQIGQLGGRVLALGSDAAMKTVQNFIEQLPSLRATLDAYLEKALEQLTPIEVVVSCVPNGSQADDYTLRVEHDEFDKALKARRLVRPHIVVKAARADLDRAVLAERMLEALAPLLASYKAKVDKKREEHENSQAWSMVGAALLVGDLFSVLFYLALLGAGALVGPVLWLLVGVGGFAALTQVPDFIIGAIKNTFFGTEIERLEAETRSARKVVEKSVKEMEIIVDPSLG